MEIHIPCIFVVSGHTYIHTNIYIERISACEELTSPVTAYHVYGLGSPNTIPGTYMQATEKGRVMHDHGSMSPLSVSRIPLRIGRKTMSV
jgi:hypothetical protein